ncbi:MAG: glycosyltransferase family 2 protein [Ardenticatenaceae bacterium]|nr:glycosyltransferase family 2 protein [Ardenticatenaceae bacterium]
MTAPFFSIIIPVYNGGSLLEICLRSIHNSEFTDWELIVVDDASSDDSVDVAQRWGAQVLVMNGRSGPAAARNKGAEGAHGRYLFFTDSDCQLHPHTLSRAAQILQANPRLDALIGSYDDEPFAPNFISQYKNLFHHYIHQTSSEAAQTFWTGCGAIQRERFWQLGGFNAKRYPRPAIEDIELGYRLMGANGRIQLAKEVQIKHLKTWTFTTLLQSDIGDRAVPWAILLQQRNDIPANLNLQRHHRLSALALFAAALSTPLTLRWQRLIVFPFLFLASLIMLNRDLYTFFKAKRGWAFALKAVPWHWLYYGYSATTYLLIYLAQSHLDFLRLH